jgi:tRNA A-37 threonylcarbamoyl transferase component Bud32/lysophospholipase L1-like esterase
MLPLRQRVTPEMLMQPSQNQISNNATKQIDGVCDRFESQWLSGQRPRMEDYLSAVPAALRTMLFRSLLPVELELLAQAGKTPREADYAKRFPADAKLVAEIFKEFASKKTGASETSVSTASTAGVRTVSFQSPDFQPSPTMEQTTPVRIGRFEILGVLGQGAFGRVYKAHDPKLDRHVAIKVPLQSALGSPDEVDRFLREARAAATLHHPNLCPVHEVGQDENGTYYIVMGYVEGTTLAAFLKDRKEPLAAKQAALIVRKLALALGAAHAKGIVHRDLKPANIMVGRERKDVIIMDFGLARHRKNGDAKETREGVVMGTPAYMSPEQARGDVKAIGPASDIYGLGVILYEMLAGKVPFSGSLTEVLGKVLHVEPQPPSTHRPGVNSQLEAICMKAIAKTPAERFASMKALADALEGYLKGMPNESIITPSKAKTNESAGLSQVVEALSAERKQERQALEKTFGKHSRNQLLVVLAAFSLLGLLIVAGGGILFFFRTPTTIVQITLVTELGIDPAQMKDAKIAYFLNNKLLEVDELMRPIELKAGEHTLIAKRDGVEIQRWVFVVHQSRDGNDAKIEIKQRPSPTSKYPEDLLANLNERGIDDNFPFLTPDGLSIYYAREGATHGPSAIYHARRAAVKEPFGKPTKVFAGRHVAVTADECYAVVLADGLPAPLLEVKRASKNVPWGAPTPIVGFNLDWNMKSPWLAPDGLSLVFNRKRTVATYPGKLVELVIARRAKRQDPWEQTQLLPMSIDPRFDDEFTWARLSDDLKSLWFSIGPARDTTLLMTATRPDVQSPFSNYRKIEVDGKPVQGQGAFYFPATKELFWSQDTTGTKADRDLRVALLEPPVADSDGWTSLFNGKDLAGWTAESGDAENWKVRDGAIVTTGVGGLENETWLLSEQLYGDCIVRFDFLAETPTANSGFALRAVPGEKLTTYNGAPHLQVEIFANFSKNPVAKLQTGTVAGGGATLTSNPIGKQNPVGEWNQIEIETRGQAIRVWLNGESVLDDSLDDLIDRGGKYLGLRRKRGRIGFQRLGGTVRFRNIQIKELASPEGEGFISLFNGKGLTGWEGLPGAWEVNNGSLHGKLPPGRDKHTFLCSTAKYRDFEMKFQVKLKNGKGNSGLQVRSNLVDREAYRVAGPQVEIDSGNSFGGLYAEGLGKGWMRQVPPAVIQRIFKPAEFNDYFVRVFGKHVKIIVNGETLVDNDFIEMADEGIIAFQLHGKLKVDEVIFRNVLIRDLSPKSTGWLPLFNGKDLTGWKHTSGAPATWKVENGYMEVVPGKGSIMTEQMFPLDFELHAEFWLPLRPERFAQARANSGIYLLGRHEIQILDMVDNPDVKSQHGCGALFGVIAPKPGGIRPPETWQTFDITYHSPRIGANTALIPGRLTVIQNGMLVIDDAPFTAATSAGLAQNANVGQPGPILLQDHNAEVRFRNLKLRPLTPPAKADAGFVSLFNGKDLSGWKTHPDQPGDWQVKDGLLIGQGAEPSHLFSQRGDYKRFHLRVEAKLNQGGDSGIIFRSEYGLNFKGKLGKARYPLGYQAQMVHSHKLPSSNLTGSLAKTGDWLVQVKEQLVRPGEWYLHEVIADGKRIVIKVNGKTTADVPDDDPAFASGHLALQAMWPETTGTTIVHFKKIEIKELPTEEAGFVPLFNGKDLTGWSTLNLNYTKEKARSVWKADPARNVLLASPGDFQELKTERQFKNFALRFQWRFAPGGNVGPNGSGVVVRSQGLNATGWDPQGIEIDLRAKANQSEEKGMGTGCFLAYGTTLTNHRGKADGDKARHLGWLREPVIRPENEWNLCEITCVGDRIKVWMNDELVNEAWDAEAAAGWICLRSQNTAVEFRDLQVKELAESTEPGFIPLFNGKDLTGWQGLVPINVRKNMTPVQYQAAVKKANEEMQGHWTVKDGVLCYDGKNRNLQTVKDYGNFELSVDWKIGPNGDSGIYLRGNPQVQIWDVNGKNNPKKVGSGGLFNNLKNPSNPLMVADNPIGQWNNFHIVMKDDKVTVKLNGKLVVDHTTMENHWERGLLLPARGPIELQHHGGQLWFKNILIKELPETPIIAPRDAKWVVRHEGFVEIAKKGDIDLLFLGDSITDGWRGESGKNVWDKAFGRLKPANFGIGGDRTEHLLWRIQNGELDGITPKVAVLLIGTNNTINESPEQIADGIRVIVNTIRAKSPPTKVLVLGIFPRGKNIPNALNTKIMETNKIIAKLDDGKNVKYLNIGQKFMKVGQIPDTIMYDHLQLTGVGYQIWADAITPSLRTMMGVGKK